MRLDTGSQLPLSIGEVFKGRLPGLAGVFQQNNLMEMWPVIAGKVIAAHSKVIRVKDSMLLIAADNLTIKKEILNRADDILLTIEQCGCGVNIKDLQVFLKKNSMNR